MGKGNGNREGKYVFVWRSPSPSDSFWSLWIAFALVRLPTEGQERAQSDYRGRHSFFFKRAVLEPAPPVAWPCGV